MRLLILSGMPHHLHDGQVVGWGPTAQEIDHLATLFDEVRHMAPLYPGPAPRSALPYTSKVITFIPVPPAGGKTIAAKSQILLRYPGYLGTILRELPQADVVHVRCPDNISLLGLLVLSLVRSPRLRWVKYAGNWRPDQPEAWSYSAQRWWLERNLHRGSVTINGRWPGQLPHIHSFVNPCLTDEELDQAKVAAADKALVSPLRLLYVGRVEAKKGVGRALEILARLRGCYCAATLHVVGDGPARPKFEALAASLNVAAATTFEGWLPRPALAPIYAQAHVMLFPTNASEGWPKVLSEAMAYGVVPVAGKVSCIGQFLDRFQTGEAIPPNQIDQFCEAILSYAADGALWKKHSANALAAAGQFTYTRYLQAVRNLLGLETAASWVRSN